MRVANKVIRLAVKGDVIDIKVMKFSHVQLLARVTWAIDLE